MNATSIGSTFPATLCRCRIRRPKNPPSSPPSSPPKLRALPLSFLVSSSIFRQPHNRRPPQDKPHRQKPTNPDPNIEFSLDINNISARTLATIKRFFRSSEAKIGRFFAAGSDAYGDLKTSVRVDRSSRIVFSCRKSSLRFFGNLFVWSFIVVLALRFLLWVWWFRYGWFCVGWDVLRRRDRSLGGREVVVGRRGFEGLANPLSSVGGRDVGLMNKKKSRQEKLPDWWPDSVPLKIGLFARDEGRRDADRFLFYSFMINVYFFF